MHYHINKAKAVYHDNTPTMTDQSGADASNINIIVGQQLITGYAPGAPKPPMYENWTDFPTDLREVLNTTKGMRELRERLPPEIKDKSVDELMRLTPNDITRIVTPPEPIKPPEEPKPK